MSEGPEYSDCPDPDEFILCSTDSYKHMHTLDFLTPRAATVLHGQRKSLSLLPTRYASTLGLIIRT